MVVIAGDGQGKLKVDDQVVAAVVDAAVERGASRIVLVTPLGGGGGGSGAGGFLGGLFGGGGGASAGPASASRGTGQLRFNRAEQKVGRQLSPKRVGGCLSSAHLHRHMHSDPQLHPLGAFALLPYPAGTAIYRLPGPWAWQHVNCRGRGQQGTLALPTCFMVSSAGLQREPALF